jgi:electron transfer flavoprotein alpha subunit
VEKVLLAEDARYDHMLAEPTAALIVSLAAPYRAIIAAATTTGKNVMPRVAALLDVMQVSDIIKVVAPDTFERPIYAGNAIQTVQATDPKIVVTVRTAAFQPTGEGGSAAIEPVAAVDDPGLSSFKGEEIAKNERPDLTSARIIVSGGRSIGSADNFKAVIGPIADRLGAAIGASRAAVDAGYAPNDWQVGQTGKVVAPDLYIAIGISGAIQHLAGMKDSKVIVAINKDEERRSSRSPITASSATCSSSFPSSSRSWRSSALSAMRRNGNPGWPPRPCGAGEARRSDRRWALRSRRRGDRRGQMGNGIAHVCALAGLDVRLTTISEEKINAGLRTITGNMARPGLEGRDPGRRPPGGAVAHQAGPDL